ncbi:MAG TPA: hypothetical protein VF711_04030, partial [Acidimicrobiales bacterium]
VLRPDGQLVLSIRLSDVSGRDRTNDHLAWIEDELPGWVVEERHVAVCRPPSTWSSLVSALDGSDEPAAAIGLVRAIPK